MAVQDAVEVTGLQGLTPGTWAIDPSHSSVDFTARHLMVSKVRGRFERFEGIITIDEQLLASHVEATVDLASVDSRDPKRDEHLRSADFFDIESFPTLQFVSTGVRPDRDDYVLTGDLTVHGVTRPVELKLEFNGVSGDPWGGQRAGFTASTELSRKDFGLEWNVALETGGVLVGDKVKIDIEIEAIRQ
jgi:polyisoprenoid-binding protein YceI